MARSMTGRAIYVKISGRRGSLSGFIVRRQPKKMTNAKNIYNNEDNPTIYASLKTLFIGCCDP